MVTLVMAVASLAGSAYTYIAGARRKEMDAVNARIKRVEDDLADHKRRGEGSRHELRERLVTVERDLGQLPTKDSFHELALSTARIEGDLKGLSASVGASLASSKRVEEWLLQNKGSVG
ncbi:hypothetical protein AUC70_11800 [Methyloceanibacter stevinii]|uniref:DUF2730 family protein n=1 Tax=Methyloceanibacter stevinii TaxID=1774970 RepID=A0A1E3VJ33_9HYPH|nr:hypothetical protein AUC70_11800 [Methyloceanibacter stevinii]